MVLPYDGAQHYAVGEIQFMLQQGFISQAACQNVVYELQAEQR